MARTNHRVRMSVRKLDESVDSGWHVNQQSWSHERYQTFDLVPMSAQEIVKANARGEQTADYVAVPTGYESTQVKEGWRLVKVDGDGDPLRYFDVVGVLDRGRGQIMLRETTAIQS